MITEILSHSWRLVWAEKRLMLFPLVGFILALIIGCFSIVALGVDLADNFSDVDIENVDSWTEEDIDRLGETFSDATGSQWIMNLIQGLVAFFIQFATLTAVFRALARQPYAVGAVFGETWSRIGRIVVFGLLIAILAAVVGVITYLLSNIFPGALAALLSLALWVAYLVVTFFLQPIAVAEDTDPIPAVVRSWELGRRVLPTLIGGVILLIIFFIVYVIGIAITLSILLLILAAIARGLIVLWVLVAIVSFAVYGLSVPVMAAAFQAQLPARRRPAIPLQRRRRPTRWRIPLHPRIRSAASPLWSTTSTRMPSTTTEALSDGIEIFSEVFRMPRRNGPELSVQGMICHPHRLLTARPGRASAASSMAITLKSSPSSQLAPPISWAEKTSSKPQLLVPLVGGSSSLSSSPSSAASPLWSWESISVKRSENWKSLVATRTTTTTTNILPEEIIFSEVFADASATRWITNFNPGPAPPFFIPIRQLVTRESFLYQVYLAV